MNPSLPVQGDPTISGMGQAQTPQDMAASLQARSPGASTGIGSTDPTVAPPSQTQSASDINSQISGNTSGVIFPQAPGAPTTGPSNNSAIPNPAPSAADIISQGTQQTPAEKTNTTLLQKVAALIGNKQSQAGMTNSAEAAAGLPALNQSRQVFADQLEALTNQATDLQNQAAPGGAIQNQEQQNALGRGITAGGLAPLSAADLRTNQIQQSTIASQALTLKSQIYAMDGKITLAKDAADKAATAAFEDQQNQIDYQNALIDANKPQMTKEEQAQADLVKQNLQDRQTQITLQTDNYKTGQAAIADALKNNPNNPQAQYAAQQAAKLDPKDPQYLQKVNQLVGMYGTDLTQRALTEQASKLDIQLKQAQIKQLADSLPPKQLDQVNKVTTALDNVPSVKTLPAVSSAFGSMLSLAANGTIATDPVAQRSLLINYAQVIQPGGMGLRAILNNLNPGDFDSQTYDAIKSAISVVNAGGQAKLSPEAINEILNSASLEYQSSASTYSSMRQQQLQVLQNEGIKNPEQYLPDYSQLNTQGSGTIPMYGPDGKQYQVPLNQVSKAISSGGSFNAPKSQSSGGFTDQFKPRFSLF